MKKIKTLISTKLLNLGMQFINSQNQNIKGELQRQALIETVDYVSVKMADIQSFSSKEMVMKKAIEACKNDGLILEFGVFTGYTINLISGYFKDKKIYGFDSFEGLPEDWRDGFPKGKFVVSDLPAVNSNVVLIKGWFNETLPDFIKDKNDNIAFLHIDCDLYISTKIVFDLLGDKIVSGTVILFDEYFNYPGWKEGEYKAFQEFIQRKNLKYKYLTYNNQHEQVAVIIE